MSDTTTRARALIEADAAWWNELGSALGWTLHGFTFREHASFIVPHQQSLASISGGEASDIRAALSKLRESE